jgi:hypothetical protein
MLRIGRHQKALKYCIEISAQQSQDGRSVGCGCALLSASGKAQPETNCARSAITPDGLLQVFRRIGRF